MAANPCRFVPARQDNSDESKHRPPRSCDHACPAAQSASLLLTCQLPALRASKDSSRSNQSQNTHVEPGRRSAADPKGPSPSAAAQRLTARQTKQANAAGTQQCLMQKNSSDDKEPETEEQRNSSDFLLEPWDVTCYTASSKSSQPSE